MVPAVLLLALVVAAHDPGPAIASWIPVRWSSHDTASLDLIRGTPVNCLLIEQRDWDARFIDAASQSGIATLGVIRPGEHALESAHRAASLKLTGVVLEGDFPPGISAAIDATKVQVIRLPSRSALSFDSRLPLLGTWQGVWPGVQIEKDGVTVSAPSGAPWIDTNAGFLRFVRVAGNGRPVWIANEPPPETVITTAAICRPSLMRKAPARIG